ncbi:MAG: hypothetical protein F6K30_06880 [Cyanothece sp. SIO2G6]|nr:hypothetical protein [Cyanothece sp. SIO2G6]
MGILKNILGEPGFAMEAGPEDKTANAAATVTAPSQEPIAPVPTEAPEIDATATAVEPSPEPAATPKRRARKSKASAENQAPVSQPVVAAPVDPIQALVDAAIAQASSETAAAAAASAEAETKTFATDYLITPTMRGRRRPGPSVAKFMDIAMTMGSR